MEYTIVLTVAQAVVVALALVVTTGILVASFTRKEDQYILSINRDLMKKVFDEAMCTYVETMTERFEPIMKAYEQAKKDNAELREALKSRQVGVVKLGKEGKLVASIGFKKVSTAKAQKSGHTLLEVTTVDKAESQKAKNRERMRAYRAKAKSKK